MHGGVRSAWVAAAILLLSCTGRPPVQGWEIRFEDSDDEVRSRHLRAWIAEDCETATHLYDVVVPQTGGPASMQPPELPGGRWAFGAESLDVDCSIHARACVEIVVPAREDQVALTLASMTPTPCVGVCPCEVRTDGGRRDAGPACTVEVDGGGICPDGFTSCGTDTACRTFTPITWQLNRASTLTSDCLSLYCASTHQIPATGCACPGGCYACLRDGDGNLTARLDEACGDPTLGTVVPTGSSGCSTAERGTTTLSCCVLR